MSMQISHIDRLTGDGEVLGSTAIFLGQVVKILCKAGITIDGCQQQQEAAD